MRRHLAACSTCAALLDQRTRQARLLGALPRHQAAAAPGGSLVSFRAVQDAALRRDEARWRPWIATLPRHEAPARLVRRIHRLLRGGRARRWVVVQAPWLAAAAALLLWIGVGMPGVVPTGRPAVGDLLGERFGPIEPQFVPPSEYDAHGLRRLVERRHGWTAPSLLREKER